MARPKRQNAEYFSHDKDMRNDLKIKALRNKFGLVGYAFFCMFLEVLTNEDFFEYEADELSLELLGGDFQINNIREILDYCIKLKLLYFDKERNTYYSKALKKRFEPLLDKRERDREFVKKRRSKYLKQTKDVEKEVLEEEQITADNPYSNCRKAFDEIYYSSSKVHYDWTDEEVASLNKIVDKLIKIRVDNNCKDTNDVLDSFVKFVESARTDTYLNNIFTLNVFEKQFNQIVNKMAVAKDYNESKSKVSINQDLVEKDLKNKSKDLYNNIVLSHKKKYMESLDKGVSFDGRDWSLNIADWAFMNDEYHKKCIDLNLPILEV